jgi:hypothetical protein
VRRIEPGAGHRGRQPINLEDAIMNPFNWIRRKAAEAVVLGTADGLRAITPAGEEPPADMGELRALLATTIDVWALTVGAAAEAEVEPTTKRKAK